MPKPTPTEQFLKVRDANAWDEFLAEARAVWCAAHGIEVRPPGRPREEKLVWKALKALQDASLNGEGRCSDAKMIAMLHERLKQEGQIVPHADTLKKYVKLDRLKRRPAAALTPQERRWLAKHDRERWQRHLLVGQRIAEMESVWQKMAADNEQARAIPSMRKTLTKEERHRLKSIQDKWLRRSAVAKKK